jgi:uncharacterized protein YjbI with pentapeptide repeats
MANEEHLAILDDGVEPWNRWREQTRTSIIPDLSNADLEDAQLHQIDFTWTNLQRANLRGSNFVQAKLSYADLDYTNFSNSNLHSADISRGLLVRAVFEGACLDSAILTGSVLWRAVFNKATLKAADLTGAHLVGTTFLGVDLSAVIGLDTVDHQGPSPLDVDTIFCSGGDIPASFLRGCGVPETLITQIPSLVGAQEGLQFHSCFISYSSRDEEFARRLHRRMRDAHLRVWFAPEEMKGGNLLIEQIETAIRVYDKLLVVLSEASLQSEWVMTELRKARKAERQSGKRKLFPVRLVDFETLRNWECFDADSGKDLAVDLREYFIPDFSNWKDHDQFEAAFSRLLKDLRAEDKPA